MFDASLKTIPELLAATVARVGDHLALGTIVDGQLVWQTWAEVDAEVRRFAAKLRQAGIGAGDRVAQWAPNSGAWIVTDLALLSLGAVHVPLHMSLAERQVVSLLKLAEAKLLIIDRGRSEAEALAKEVCLPFLRHKDLFAAEDASPIQDSAQDPAKSDGLATLLFTSGTTGQPRGVMLSHQNLASNAIALSEAVGSNASETRLGFLPLSHIYARTCDLYTWLYRGSRLVLAESRDTIIRDCQLARPTVINGVPYFYQKIAQQLQGTEPGALQRLFGGQLKRCYCGGAAMAPEVEALFEQQGLPILTGYGLTETSPVVSATTEENYQAGSVGRPLPEVDVRISAEGEILVRGPNVMQGYWNDPAATAEAIVDGWLHTGDLGELDATGQLRIVGRQKELIVLSTGKNIAPSRVEQRLAGSPLVELVCVVGDGRKCLGSLIVPNPEALRNEIRRQGLWVWSRRRAVTHPRIREWFRQEIDRVLAPLSAEEQVGRFTILDRNFSIEQGELTTKLSLCRKTIAENFSRDIERMYIES